MRGVAVVIAHVFDEVHLHQADGVLEIFLLQSAPCFDDEGSEGLDPRAVDEVHQESAAFAPSTLEAFLQALVGGAPLELSPRLFNAKGSAQIEHVRFNLFEVKTRGTEEE